MFYEWGRHCEDEGYNVIFRVIAVEASRSNWLTKHYVSCLAADKSLSESKYVSNKEILVRNMQLQNISHNFTSPPVETRKRKNIWVMDQRMSHMQWRAQLFSGDRLSFYGTVMLHLSERMSIYKLPIAGFRVKEMSRVHIILYELKFRQKKTLTNKAVESIF